MHSKLSIEAEEKDWRWDYSYINKMHFINCPVYSQILTSQNDDNLNHINNENKKDILILEPKIFGIGINLKQLFNKIFGK